jgi:hypothetical protein
MINPVDSANAAVEVPHNQGVAGVRAAPAPGSGDDFAAVLKSFMKTSSSGSVNEEELFAGLVQKMASEKDAAAAGFNQHFQSAVSAHTRSDGYIAYEDATKTALKKSVADQTLTQEEASQIYSTAFAAAQLDSNQEALFDGRGSEEDNTVAVAEIEQGILRAKDFLAKLAAGEIATTARDLNEASNAAPQASGGEPGRVSADPSSLTAGARKAEDGPEGFVYKPVSDSDGNLVVLLPAEFTGAISQLVLKEGDEVIAKGRFTSVANGGREHYRFSKPGKEYPDGLTVEATLEDGRKVTYAISDSSRRWD